MPSTTTPIVLGSRSPRRRELLALLVGEARVDVRPPVDASEVGFDDVATAEALHRRLCELAATKADDVVCQLRTDGSLAGAAAVVTADTVVVVTPPDGRPLVLGQPPASDDWQSTVRDWFRRYYFGRTHQVATAVCLTLPDGRRWKQLTTTGVHFRDDAEAWLEWYLATGEPRGKAGGYGLQGAGSLFVDRIEGSPSNVIGLPLRETAEMLTAAGVHLDCRWNPGEPSDVSSLPRITSNRLDH